MSSLHQHRRIPGTPIFDGAAAQRGYALNRMCYSLNHADNRASLLRDADGYCRRFGMSDVQIDAVRRKDVLELIAAGGNIYYLAKLAGAYGLSVQDIGAQQTGMSADAFRAKLCAAGEC
jgi:protocatechuate 4,5-dioxygenase alpha chain